MQELFTRLTHAVEGTAGVALAASFLWGVLSVVLSPCHLASIPLIVAFISGQGKVTTKRAFAISTLFSIGIFITIAVIGVITALLGRMLGNIGPAANYFVAGVFILVGLVLLDVIAIPICPAVPKASRKGLLPALLLGLIFGIAIGPCTFAYMAPMLAVSFKLASTQQVYSILLLVVYGIGHCSVITLAGTSTRLVQKYADYSEKSKTPLILKRVCAVLVILAGLYLIYIT